MFALMVKEWSIEFPPACAQFYRNKAGRATAVDFRPAKRAYQNITHQRWITRQFARRGRWINFGAGILLVGIEIYDLWVNWGFITSGVKVIYF
jgi:hypothetical protein